MRSLQLSRGSQEGRQIKYRKAFLSDKSFSLCFFKWEVSLLDWIKMADLSAEQPQSTQLWRALLFPSSGSHCCWDQSTPVKASLWWKRTHIKTCMNASRWQMQRNSPAHSECCCLSGLCSAPAVTSSLCLCCRWCTSSLGCPSFCWRGTFLLFPLPGESERFTALCETRTDFIWPINMITFLFSSHGAENDRNALQKQIRHFKETQPTSAFPTKTKHSHKPWVGNDRLSGDLWIIDVCLKWIWLPVGDLQDDSGILNWVCDSGIRQWNSTLVIDRYFNLAWRRDLAHHTFRVATPIKTVDSILLLGPQQTWAASPRA